MNNVHVILRAQGILDLMILYRDFLDEAFEELRRKSKEYAGTRQRKRFLWRSCPWTQDRIKFFQSIHFDHYEIKLRETLEDLTEKANWSTKPAGFDVLLVTEDEFDFIRIDFQHYTDQLLTYFKDSIDANSVKF